MEGPSIILLKEELRPFENKKVSSVAGNTRIAKEQLKGRKLSRISSWGKLLLLDFEGLHLKVHFLMYGSYRIDERKEREPRLQLRFGKRELNLYSCSVKFLEEEPEKIFDWRRDPMSPEWSPALAVREISASPDKFLCDLLLDQDIFAGVGNIIKNEVLFNRKLHPLTKAGLLSAREIGLLVKETENYCRRFLEWKRQFLLRKNWKVYRKPTCPDCGEKVRIAYTGRLQRRSFFCPRCQRMPERPAAGKARSARVRPSHIERSRPAPAKRNAGRKA